MIGFVTLSGTTQVFDASFSGFDYPASRQVVSLIASDSAGGNAVVQQSGLGIRLAELSGEMFRTDLDLVRDAYDTGEPTQFTDHEGVVWSVVILEFAASYRFSDLWGFNLRMAEVAADPALVGPGVGVPVAGLDTTLATDPAIGATNLRVASVTTVTAGQFIRVGAAGVTATELNSEVARVLVVGTAGAGGTGLDIESDTGGGMVLDHASADEVKTVTGTLLAAPAARGATTVLVDSVAGLSIGTVVRLGYLDRYETRTLLTVGTAGPAGTGVTFAAPLLRDHSLDEWLVVIA